MDNNKIDFADLVPSEKDIKHTPMNICYDIINMVPDTAWNRNTKVLDINSKSGRFLKCAYDKLFNCSDMSSMKPDERRKYILNNQLYGITGSIKCANVIHCNLYGKLDNNINNIRYIKGITDKSWISRPRLNSIKEEFGSMNFNIVVGNPPYNKGMDLDFIDLGYKISSQYTCMIVPAKWQSTADDYTGCASKNINYAQFRELYTKHMNKIAFYPDCLDIFEISLCDGITYFLLDKQEHEKCEIINKCVRQPYFNNVSIRDIRHHETLNNAGQEIIDSLGDYKKYTWYEITNIDKKYYIATTALFSASLGQGGSYDWATGGIKKGSAGQGGMLLTKDGKVNVLSRSDILKSGIPFGASAKITFQSDSIEECNNFISYLYSKFVKFFLLINESQMSNAVKPDWFRFVPAPDITPAGEYDFSHPYSDEYLYRKYNLSEQHIKIIEAVIKDDNRIDGMMIKDERHL